MPSRTIAMGPCLAVFLRTLGFWEALVDSRKTCSQSHQASQSHALLARRSPEVHQRQAQDHTTGSGHVDISDLAVHHATGHTVNLSSQGSIMDKPMPMDTMLSLQS